MNTVSSTPTCNTQWEFCHFYPASPFIMLIHLLLCLMRLGFTQCFKQKTADGYKLLINNLKPPHGLKVHALVLRSSLIEKSSAACLLKLRKCRSSLHGCFLLHYHWWQWFLNWGKKRKRKREKLTELLSHNVWAQSPDGIRLLLQVWPLFEVPQCELLFRWRVCGAKWLYSTLSICFKLFSAPVLDESLFFKTDFGLNQRAITARRAATSLLSPHRNRKYASLIQFTSINSSTNWDERVQCGVVKNWVQKMSWCLQLFCAEKQKHWMMDWRETSLLSFKAMSII